MRTRLGLSRVQASIAVIVAAAALALAWIVSAPSVWWPSVVLAFPLAWLAMIDIDRHLLPDAITLSLLLAGLAIALPQGWGVLADRAIGTFVGYAVLAGIALIYRRWRGVDGLGGGDAKLLAAGGAWLGWIGLPMIVLIASLTGLAYVAISHLWVKQQMRDGKIAFGPFLALGIWVGWIGALAI